MECNKYQKSFGVAFNVVFEDKVTRPPKKLSLVEKEPLTLAQIKEKQQLADKRRQERIAARLKRMHQREESTKKLAQSVAILLQQQSLRTGEIKESSDVQKMSQREIMKTANEVSQRFHEMQCQLISVDLKVDETAAQLPKRKNCSGDRAGKVSLKQLNTEKGNTCSRILSTGLAVKENPSELIERKAKGTTFEIPVNEVKKTSQKKLISSQTKNWKSDRKLTAEELNEIQQRAAERSRKGRKKK